MLQFKIRIRFDKHISQNVCKHVLHRLKVTSLSFFCVCFGDAGSSPWKTVSVFCTTWATSWRKRLRITSHSSQSHKRTAKRTSSAPRPKLKRYSAVPDETTCTLWMLVKRYWCKLKYPFNQTWNLVLLQSHTTFWTRFTNSVLWLKSSFQC